MQMPGSTPEYSQNWRSSESNFLQDTRGDYIRIRF